VMNLLYVFAGVAFFMLVLAYLDGDWPDSP
jgi:hypothetical protein